MAKKVFFSFHYENDVWRTNIVRNSWVTKPDSQAAGFIDAAEFEQIKRGGETAIKEWINNQLNGTTVTVVLIGSETNARQYVQYELEESWKRGNGILGIYIHQLKGKHGETSAKGSDSFGPLFLSSNDDRKYFYERFKVYDWVADNGYTNLGIWVEDAAKQAKR
jgi:hypothetical protein